MDLPQFSDSEFLDHNALNAAFNLSYASDQQVTDLTNSPGLINPSLLTFTPSALTITVAAPSPFAVLFGNGALTGAHGTTDGADTTSTVVSLSSLVPGSGSVTAYILASFTQVQESPYEVVGPPAGHPDFNPSFAAYAAYAEKRDSLALTASTTAPNNLTTFELCRTTLTAGQTSITSVDTTHQIYASSLLNPTGVTAGVYPGATVTVGADGRITGIFASGNGRLIGIQAFANPGTTTYTPTAGTTRMIGYLIGGGGAGGGAPATGAGAFSCGGGGGSGALCWFQVINPTSSALVIGAGGVGVSGGVGGNGSSSSFAGTFTASGGTAAFVGGPSAVGFLAQPGVGGARGSTANILDVGGNPGTSGITLGTAPLGGNGGASPMFAGGGFGSSGLSGGNATSPGAGGGGSSNGPSAGAQSGASGAAGQFIAWEYS